MSRRVYEQFGKIYEEETTHGGTYTRLIGTGTIDDWKPIERISDNPRNTEPDQWTDKLTKRELFAAMAMQGMCANNHYDNWSYKDVAYSAVHQADALINALNEVKP